MEPRLLDRLRAREREMTELLAELVRAESPSLARAEGGALTILARELEAAGYVSRRLRGAAGQHLYARPRRRARGAPRQLVLGHVDTVWPLGTVDERPPARDDGRLFGPGAYDMKGGLVQLVFALRALEDEGLVPSVTPVVLVNSDEEVGSMDSVRWIRMLAGGACRAYVLEPPAGVEGRLKTRRKGVGRYRLTVHGRAAHAGSSPEQGASAILELARQVERLFSLNDPGRGITVNVGTIDGGLYANVVAAEATALVDVRTPTSPAAAELDRALRDPGPLPPGVSVSVDNDLWRPPMAATPGNTALCERARRIGARLGLDLAEAGLVGGASDANFTSELTPTLDGLGALGHGAHANDEHVVVRALPERAALLALLLLEPR